MATKDEPQELTQSQLYKKQFFGSCSTFFSKKSKFVDYNVKDTTKILSNIANQPKFSQIRSRYKIKKFLSKFLLKSHINWILYAFVDKNILKIAVSNHIGQSELNMQKMTILKYCANSKDYNHIDKVSVFRDETFQADLSNISKNDNCKSNITFKEKSYAIFDDNITDINQKKIIARIKKYIKRQL